MQSLYGSCRKKRELVLCSRILSRARITTPITTLNTAEINALTDLEFDVEKQLGFSEYWHNEEKFYVHQILDDEYKRGKR